MDRSEGRFTIRRRSPDGVIADEVIQTDQTVAQVVTFFASGALDADRLVQFVVEEEVVGAVRDGEQFCEDNPELVAVAAWEAGGEAARRERQRKMHEWWPNLGMALSALAEAFPVQRAGTDSPLPCLPVEIPIDVELDEQDLIEALCRAYQSWRGERPLPELTKTQVLRIVGAEVKFVGLDGIHRWRNGVSGEPAEELLLWAATTITQVFDA